MDRSTASVPEHSTAVRTAGDAALDLLLPAAAGERGEPRSAPPARRTVPEVPLLRKSEDGRRAGGEPQTRPAVDAHSGHRSTVSQTQLEPPGAGSPDLPVPAARRRHRTAQPRLEHRYYLRSDAWRLSLPGRGDGLVQPVRTQLGAVQHHGDQLLCGGAERRFPLWPTRNLELRSGLAVYLGRLPGSPQE